MAGGQTAYFLLTGGPGAGKTSVIAELARRGEATTVEAGRAIIAAAQAAGAAHPWRDPVAFALAMTDWDIKQHRRHADHPGSVFCDRGIPDNIGYLALIGLPAPERILEAAARYRYRQTAFIFPPWREIYVQDGERQQDFAEACRTYDNCAAAYLAQGYRLIEVPRAPIAARADFILAATNG